MTFSPLPLRKYSQPDLSNYVVHLTGRKGPKPSAVPPDVKALNGVQRLGRILLESRILAFEPFGGEAMKHPVVCLSECAPSGIRTLLGDRKYEPYGIAFSKDFVFRCGGGPVYYVRGDEWQAALDGLPSRLAVRAMRYWPGTAPGPDGKPPVGSPEWSDWTHEREWRIHGEGAEPSAFPFERSEVQFVILPDKAELVSIAALAPLRATRSAIASLPVLVLAPDGAVVEDAWHFWA